MGSWMLFVLGAVAVVIVTYSRISTLFDRRRSLFAEIESQSEEKYALVLSLIEMARPDAREDEKLFKEVMQAYSATKDAYGIGQKRFKAEADLKKAISNLVAFADNMTALKENQDYKKLRQDLGEIEAKISEKCEIFNETTKNYNKAISQFPGKTMAKFGNYGPEPCL